MYKLLFFLLSIFIFLSITQSVKANYSAYASIVNPVRGSDFWELKNQQPETAVLGQIDALKKYNFRATFLLRYDALSNIKIIDALKNQPHEKGLFLEITPSWTNSSGVTYNKSDSWHFAQSALLTGYETHERERLIDSAFERFKEVFGIYPESVGAWWIDAYSLNYMQTKYGIKSSLIVSDQYSTDNYQIWGQYFSTPYYPSKTHALHPAQTKNDKMPVVILQWAARDPINAYGKGVEESTYSVQANDYIDFHNLDIGYFSKLLDIYTQSRFNSFGQITIGLENSYDWSKYKSEYEKQLEVLDKKNQNGQFSIATMQDFADWYITKFPNLSPEHIIEAEDPLGTKKRVVWFMNSYYRTGWFYDENGSSFKDVRQYLENEKELCLDEKCSHVNFATFATRVLDDVSFGHKLLLDEGDITNYKLRKEDEKYILSYKNINGIEKFVEFLPRDININGRIFSIDSLILEANKQIIGNKQLTDFKDGGFDWPMVDIAISTFKFILFLLVGGIVPGFILLGRIFERDNSYLKLFLATILGLVITTILFFILSIIGLRQLIYIYFLLNLILLIKHSKNIKPNIKVTKFGILIFLLICAGTIFQIIPTIRSGLIFPYGMGFWGPNGHDGVWHLSLINQLIISIPPQNPVYSGELLRNYHFFYDLLVALTNYISKIAVPDLLFRFYPALFSLLLGVGSFFLIKVLVGQSSTNKYRYSTFFGLYFVYFAGSFGWIVDYIKNKGFSGESAFWANQSISFNLNPPFAISLIIVIAIFILIAKINTPNKLLTTVLIIFCGTLISFKAYAGILILLTLLTVGILKRSMQILIIFISSILISAGLLLSNFKIGETIFLLSPFWFIHSMVDSPDRLGWVRLSLMREDGLANRNWIKFLFAEGLSLAIFIVGNLGTRIIFVFGLLNLKKVFSKNEYLFISTFSFLAVLIPLLFIQAGNPWNTIQFIYYFLYIAALTGGIVFANLLHGVKKVIILPFASLVLVLTPINSWATANSYFVSNPHAFISANELEALTFIKSQPDGVILTYPYDEHLKRKISEPWPLFVYDSTSYVSALTSKRVYLEDEQQNLILLNDYKTRVALSKNFFNNPEKRREFLIDNSVKYIYVLKKQNLKIGEEDILNKIFENDEVTIYQFKK